MFLESNPELTLSPPDIRPQNAPSLDTMWAYSNNQLIKAGRKVLGAKPRRMKDWMSSDTWQLIEERKKTKQVRESAQSVNEMMRTADLYNSLNKQVKKSCRRDKRVWYENLATAANKDMKLLYDITKEISGRKRYQSRPIKDVHGNLLTSTDDQVKRFKEYFNSILNNPDLPPPTEPTMPAEHMITRSSSLSTTPPEMDEIINAIQAMKNNKSPGIDSITAEMLIACSNTTAQLLHPLFNKI